MFQIVETHAHKTLSEEFPKYDLNVRAHQTLQKLPGRDTYKYYPLVHGHPFITFERMDTLSKIELVRLDGQPIHWGSFSNLEIGLGKIKMEVEQTALLAHFGESFVCDIGYLVLGKFQQVYPNIQLIHDPCYVIVNGEIPADTYCIRVTHKILDNCADILPLTFPGAFCPRLVSKPFTWKGKSVDVLPETRSGCSDMFIILNGLFKASRLPLIILQHHGYISSIPLVECKTTWTHNKTVIQVPVASQGILSLNKMDFLGLSFQPYGDMEISGTVIFVLPTFLQFSNWDLV